MPQTGWSLTSICFQNAFLPLTRCVTTPSAPSKVASRHLLDVASTPPHGGGEFAQARSSTLRSGWNHRQLLQRYKETNHVHISARFYEICSGCNDGGRSRQQQSPSQRRP